MKALVLSGGSGTRLRPLTYTNAKQLVPIANKPILFYILEKLADCGIKDIGIVVGDTFEEVKSAVGSGEKWNTRITYIYQSLPLGLAHAVKTAEDFIKEDDFIMILGDNLFEMSLDKLIESFYTSKSNVSLLLHKVKDPSHFGVAVVEADKVIKLVEKPKEWVSDLIITGVYVFNKLIFEAISKTSPSKRGELEITDAIQKLLEIGGKVNYVMTEGWWKDTGKISDVLEANQLVLETISNMKNYEYNVVAKVRTGENTLIQNCIIRGPVVVGSNCTIENCYIGPYTSVGDSARLINCEVENTILLEGVQIENVKNRIGDSLIGKNAKITGETSKPLCMKFFLGDKCEVFLN